MQAGSTPVTGTVLIQHRQKTQWFPIPIVACMSAESRHWSGNTVKNVEMYKGDLPGADDGAELAWTGGLFHCSRFVKYTLSMNRTTVPPRMIT